MGSWKHVLVQAYTKTELLFSVTWFLTVIYPKLARNGNYLQTEQFPQTFNALYIIEFSITIIIWILLTNFSCPYSTVTSCRYKLFRVYWVRGTCTQIRQYLIFVCAKDTWKPRFMFWFTNLVDRVKRITKRSFKRIFK